MTSLTFESIELHLLEYHQRMLEYLTAFEARKVNVFQPVSLQEFSTHDDPNGYDDNCITNDMITDVYVEFVNKTRQQESTSYCKTRTGQSLTRNSLSGQVQC
jgi:hypothetical protein